jgi:hypothetical protein
LQMRPRKSCFLAVAGHPINSTPGNGIMATTAAKLRAEAARMRERALTETNPAALAEIKAMIEEWERRAREMADGDGRS